MPAVPALQEQGEASLRAVGKEWGVESSVPRSVSNLLEQKYHWVSCRGLELKQQAKHWGENINLQMAVVSGRAVEGSQRWLKDGINVSEPKEQEQQCFFTFLWYKLF